MTKRPDLIFSLTELILSDYDYIHPVEIMKDLGIQYDSLSIHTLNDSWVFWGCDINEDFELPSFLSILLER